MNTLSKILTYLLTKVNIRLSQNVLKEIREELKEVEYKPKVEHCHGEGIYLEFIVPEREDPINENGECNKIWECEAKMRAIYPNLNTLMSPDGTGTSTI